MTGNFQRPQRLNWPDLPMPTARMACFSYILLIIYASIYPFNFNVSVGATYLDWTLAPIPQYITSFDVFTNILGYLPLGFLIVFAVYPRLKSYRALLLSIIIGALLSAGLESLQTWLVTRIPSNVDWWANISGVAIGALVAITLDPAWLSGSVFQRKRIEWFGVRSSGILLLLAFPWAQIYPQTAWLAMGGLATKWPNSSLWTSTFNFATIEIATTMLAWIFAGISIALTMRKDAPKLPLLFCLLIATIILKGLFSGMQFGADKSFAWLTPPALWGMIFSTILLFGVLQLNRVYLYLIGVCALLGMLFLVNFLPQNPYYLVTIQEWRQGRLLHFNHLMSWLAWIWPVAACLSLIKGLKLKSSI